MANSNKAIMSLQRLEKTCELIYHWLAHRIKDENNSHILHQIAYDEADHYKILKSITGRDVKPLKGFMWFFRIVSRLLGITFGIKLIEKKEQAAIETLNSMEGELFVKLMAESGEHDQELLNLIDEERLKYLSSIVLGLNDALVELTGALAGYTFAFANTKLIAVTGLITGISASFSMAASEYLSSRADSPMQEALRSSLYTGMTYVLTVAILILPFLLIPYPYVSLAVTLLSGLFIIVCFTYYMSVAMDYPFKRRFGEMALISLGVAALSFLIGILVKNVFGLDI